MTREAQVAPVETRATAPPVAQHKCECGATAGARGCGCGTRPVRQSIGAGFPLDGNIRASMERAFGHDFSNIRIHTDDRAAASARDSAAQAYTVGTHIVFGADRYATQSRAGRRLLAHELTHTLQQRHGLAMQRQVADGEPGADAAEREADRVAEQVSADTPAGVVVGDDAADVRPGQMHRLEFLEAVRAAACAAADAELARAGRSTAGCPYVEQAFATYRDASVERVNRAIAFYVGAAESATAAIRAIAARVGEGTRGWVETGQVPDGVASSAETTPSASPAEEPPVQAKLRDGGVPSVAPEASSVRASLGEGTPLDAGLRSRMESSFGFNFADVRLHTDARAAATATRHDALALTVGNDIAFAPAEYRPGSLEGDALLAHELAHVVQQRDGGDGASAAADLEDDADLAAIHSVAGAWAGVRRFVRSAMPRLRGGVRVSRCSRCPKSTIINRTIDVFELAGTTLTPASDVPAGLAVWRSNAGIEFTPTFHPAVDESTTRSLIGTDQASGIPVSELHVDVTGGSTTDVDNLTAHASAAGATGNVRAFYVPSVMYGGHTGPPRNTVYIATTCRPGFTLAHELGHIYLGAGHSRNWDSPLMQMPQNCGSDAIDDLECRMVRGDQEAWREYGRRRLSRSRQ